ncbi:nineteen complex- protein [Ancistrocladus abbreviatus]
MTPYVHLVAARKKLEPFGSSLKGSRVGQNRGLRKRVMENPRIEVLWNLVMVEAYRDEENGVLGGLKVKNVVTDLKVSGLFFVIGHEPATKFLGGQLDLDSNWYVVTKPGTTQTSMCGVFVVGDVQDKKYRQVVTAAGTG